MTESSPFDTNPTQRITEFYDVINRKAIKGELPRNLAAALIYHMPDIKKAYEDKSLPADRTIFDSDLAALEAVFDKFAGKSFASYNIAHALMKDIPKKFQPYCALPAANPAGDPKPELAKPSSEGPGLTGNQVEQIFEVKPTKTESLETILGTASALMEKLNEFDKKVEQANTSYSGVIDKVKADYAKEVSALAGEKEKISSELRDYASRHVSALTTILSELQKYAGQKPATDVGQKETQKIGTDTYNRISGISEDLEKSRKNWKKGAIGATLAALLSMGSCVALNKYGKSVAVPVAPSALLMYNGNTVPAPYNTTNPVQVTIDVSGNSVVTRLNDLVTIPKAPEGSKLNNDDNKPKLKAVTCYQCDGEKVVSEIHKNKSGKCPKGWKAKLTEKDCKPDVLPTSPVEEDEDVPKKGPKRGATL
ncbi:TPA: hypothetical protein HA219_01285 [Candidatus Woesearchaeota archaeon]|nr:hypothetical protein [Candidatus Woesearchaeota archaeon]HIH39339.1 hypothetical protein [Candidatus Woesearchaeota archaeon]